MADLQDTEPSAAVGAHQALRSEKSAPRLLREPAGDERCRRNVALAPTLADGSDDVPVEGALGHRQLAGDVAAILSGALSIEALLLLAARVHAHRHDRYPERETVNKGGTSIDLPQAWQRSMQEVGLRAREQSVAAR